MNKWILQVSPAHCNIWPSYFYDVPMDEWDANRYHDLLAPGDRAAIWICGNRGQPWRVDGGVYHAGVYGFATLANHDPFLEPRAIPPDRGWCDEDVGKLRWWVKLRDSRWLDRLVLRSTLKADPHFEGAEILTMPRATNPFYVTDDQWRAITSRARGRRPA